MTEQAQLLDKLVAEIVWLCGECWLDRGWYCAKHRDLFASVADQTSLRESCDDD